MNGSLVNYLQHVRNLEALLYTQNLVIASLTSKANALGISRKSREQRRIASGFFSENIVFFLFLAGIIAVIVAKLAYDPIWDSLSSKYIAESGNYYFGKNSADRFWDTISSCAVLAVVVMALVLLIIKCIDVICRKREQRQLNVAYEKKLKQHNRDDRDRVRRELAVKQGLLQQIESVKNKRDQTKAALTQLYDMGIIAEKYWGLVPVSMFCEYLEVGRCYTLTGHEGAYNIYEYERRMDLIITQLEEIKTKLDEIRENQFALYQIMTEANNTLARINQTNNRMMKSMASIERNTELTAFNTKASTEIARATGEFIVMKELLK